MKNIEKLEAFLRGGLSENELNDVQNKIETDPIWKAEYEFLKNTFDILRSTATEAAPVDAYFNNFLPRLRDRIDRNSGARQRVFKKVVPATAVAAAFLAITIWWMRSPLNDSEALWLVELGNPVENLIDACDSDSARLTTLSALEALETGDGEEWYSDPDPFEGDQFYPGIDEGDLDLVVVESEDPLAEPDLSQALADLSDREFEVLVTALEDFDEDAIQ